MHLQRLALRRAGVVLMVIFSLAVVAVAVHRGLREKPAAPGKPLPVLSLVELDGAPASLRPQAGVALYNVFATWCTPCAMEMPTLAAAAPRLRAHGIALIGIDQGDPPAAVRAFITRYDLSYPILIDDEKTTNALLGARIIPETVLVRNGIVAQTYVGPLTPQALDRMVGVR
ncbi:MAG TPA: TlpA disulfide reductase family protein [Candidatus Baltobacteraceae bacterium]|nr:TlpA disulfide reductase family protein [Candidatus Baltobacteraceae bacterium]